MGGGQSAPDRPGRIVIVGGGYAGCSLAQIASPRFKVTLIDRRPVTIHKIGGIRSAVADGWSGVAAVPLDKVIGANAEEHEHKVIHAAVDKIDREGKSVMLADGTSVEYDFLVLAMGGESLSPADPPQSCITAEECSKYFKGVAEEVKSSKHILLVGGGAVGFELAGEIRHYRPEVKVTICESSNKLSRGFDDNLSDNLLKIAERNGVHVIFNDRVKSQDGPGEGLDTSDILQTKMVKPKDGLVPLASNKTVEDVDLVFWCVGFRPLTDLLKQSGMESKLDERGLIKVDEYLQVEGETNIFAIGDCNNVKEVKLAMTAGSNTGKSLLFPPGNADAVLANILAASDGKPLVRYTSQYQAPKKAIVTFGPKQGYAKGLPQFLVSTKTKTMMIDMRWKQLNGKPPALPKI